MAMKEEKASGPRKRCHLWIGILGNAFSLANLILKSQDETVQTTHLPAKSGICGAYAARPVHILKVCHFNWSSRLFRLIHPFAGSMIPVISWNNEGQGDKYQFFDVIYYFFPLETLSDQPENIDLIQRQYWTNQIWPEMIIERVIINQDFLFCILNLCWLTSFREIFQLSNFPNLQDKLIRPQSSRFVYRFPAVILLKNQNYVLLVQIIASANVTLGGMTNANTSLAMNNLKQVQYRLERWLQ